MSDKRIKNPVRRFLKAFLLTVILSITVMFVIINIFDLPMRNEPADVSPGTTLSQENKKRMYRKESFLILSFFLTF